MSADFIQSGLRKVGFNTTQDLPQIEEIRQQLGRILRSTPFRDAFRLTRFLNFVVEQTLAGDGARLKAYTIAVEALDRGSDFDPQNNPIVRVEAGRLRQALARYYAGAGAHDPIMIDLPRGAYVPTFSRCDPERPTPAAAARPSARPINGADGPAEIENRRRNLDRLLALIRDLVESHRLQVELLAAQIESAAAEVETLAYAAACADVSSLACRPAPPLLPTAPSSQPDAPRTADGRQDQQNQQAQGAPAARPCRPRAGGDRRDAADDGDDPPNLRALRLRAR